MTKQLKTVCVQGLGFVGSAMAAAIADARSVDGSVLYQVVGVDLDTLEGRRRIASIQDGKFPFSTEDMALQKALTQAKEIGNLSATDDDSIYECAHAVIIDVGLDIQFQDVQPAFLASLRRRNGRGSRDLRSISIKHYRYGAIPFDTIVNHDCVRDC